MSNISVNKDTKLKLRCHTRDNSNDHDQVRTISLLNVTNIINTHVIITVWTIPEMLLLSNTMYSLYSGIEYIS